ncbi:J domain-containing protein [Pedococcus sp. KACC 23699]|uniref:J domain-containing protein n=1 Tax=Pedococcus sp. KACC 23699 TaxID=3149228 RepID=A0AAU7JZP5_9MICO
MDDPFDPYAVLGVSPQATQTEIRRAYRAMVRRSHPDTSPQSGRGPSTGPTLQELMAAYEILGDPSRRTAHDHATIRIRHHSPETGGAPAVRTPADARTQPPIQAGPVRWHRDPGTVWPRAHP